VLIFWSLLIINTVTLIVAIVAASYSRNFSSRLIVVVAICAFLAALHQVATDMASPIVLLLNALLVALMFYRIRMIAWGNRKK
jgi:hypothetical protein